MNRKKLFFGFSFALVVMLLFFSTYFFRSQYSVARQGQSLLPTTTFLFGGQIVEVELATTDTQRAHGLSNRATLPDNRGMLFVFSEDDRYGFWMKDMRFPIDIVWLDASYHIVDMRQAVDPSSYPTIFYPAVLARYALELPAGFIEKNGLSIGSRGQTLEKIQ